MRVTLAAEADNGDALAFDEVQIGIPVIVNAHDGSSSAWRIGL
jgi:hypothetical protein